VTPVSGAIARKRRPGERWSNCLPVVLWPACDQAAWEKALQPGDIFDPGGVASGWPPVTQRKRASGYGRYLFFLDERGELDAVQSPADRITPERLRAYVAELQRTTRGHSIQNRIQELGDAMRALAPEGDWRWILRAASRLRASTVPAINKRARLRPIPRP
jgi:integrase/recombinase XerD